MVKTKVKTEIPNKREREVLSKPLLKKPSKNNPKIIIKIIKKRFLKKWEYLKNGYPDHFTA